MSVAVTGTPGTGKTTATELVDTDLELVHLNELIESEGLHQGRDSERGSLVADIEAIEEYLGEGDYLLDSHLAHQLPVERVVVLRCHPEKLEQRLDERDEPEAKIAENAESEALDVVLSEAVERHGLDAVYEIDTTDRTPEEVAGEIERVLAGEREPSAGEVTFIEYL